MKKIYWRPSAVSKRALTLIALVSLAGLMLVERLPMQVRLPNHEQKLAAARLARDMMEVIRLERVRLGHAIDPATDPGDSGLIGVAMTPVTSVSGNLVAKQTSVNPNFAAVIVDMLIAAGVREGDMVAVGVSGSFPAINACVYAAIEILKAKAVVVSSTSASQWGANLPDLLWIDMEALLRREGLTSIRIAGASLGGYEDRGLGMPEDARAGIVTAIKRNGLPLIEADSFAKSVETRMEVFRKGADGANFRAYINVGGGTASVGGSIGKRLFKPGLTLRVPAGAKRIDGVMPRMSQAGIPVIHLSQIEDIAERYGLPAAPTQIPEVGVGRIYSDARYNRWLVSGVLSVILLLLYGFLRSDLGFRVFQSARGHKTAGPPQPMV